MTLSNLYFGKLPRTWTIASGENFDAHPAQTANFVNLIFFAVILFPWALFPLSVEEYTNIFLPLLQI